MVVSPLISIMEEQKQDLEAMGIVTGNMSGKPSTETVSGVLNDVLQFLVSYILFRLIVIFTLTHYLSTTYAVLLSSRYHNSATVHVLLFLSIFNIVRIGICSFWGWLLNFNKKGLEYINCVLEKFNDILEYGNMKTLYLDLSSTVQVITLYKFVITFYFSTKQQNLY
jgi:hypothetical protein